ncbi:hypothetical protein SCUP234_05392 [Seiridium cupressi]
MARQHAVILASAHAYMPDDPSIPAWFPSFPQDLLIDGKIKLEEGEEGWAFGTDSTGTFSHCQFQRNAQAVDFVVPAHHLRVGKLKGLSVTNDHRLQVAHVAVQKGNTRLEAFIRTFWTTARRDLGRLVSELLLSENRAQYLFDNAYFATNLDAVIDAIMPAVKEVLCKDNFSIKDLLQLPCVDENYERRDIAYLRIYHRHDGETKPTRDAGYGGITIDPPERYASHNDFTESSTSYHYHVARRYHTSDRIMLPIMDLSGFDEHRKAMAEETIVAMFGTIASWHMTSDPSMNWEGESGRARYVGDLRKQVIARTGFSNLYLKGCNVLAPLFHESLGGKVYTKFNIPPAPGRPRMLVFKTACTFPKIVVAKDGRPAKASIYLARHLAVTMAPETLEQLQYKRGHMMYLVVEITADGSRHPDPWVSLPTIGLYENFADASSVAIRLEVCQPETNKWESASLYCIRSTGKPTNGIHQARPFIKAMKIIQLLKQIQWSTTNDGFPVRGYSFRSMFEANYSHLDQKLTWNKVATQIVYKEPPARASWLTNGVYLQNVYPDLLLGPKERPSCEDFLTWSGALRSCCDACMVLAIQRMGGSGKKCEATGEGRCNLCDKIYNRPCTWTPTNEIKGWTDEKKRDLFYIKTHDVKVIKASIPEPFGGWALLQTLHAGDEVSYSGGDGGDD